MSFKRDSNIQEIKMMVESFFNSIDKKAFHISVELDTSLIPNISILYKDSGENVTYHFDSDKVKRKSGSRMTEEFSVILYHFEGHFGLEVES